MICYLKYGFRGSNRSVLCSFRNLSFCILKIVLNLSNLFEDPYSVRDTGHALVLLLNTYTRFQTIIEVYSSAVGTK